MAWLGRSVHKQSSRYLHDFLSKCILSQDKVFHLIVIVPPFLLCHLDIVSSGKWVNVMVPLKFRIINFDVIMHILLMSNILKSHKSCSWHAFIE